MREATPCISECITADEPATRRVGDGMERINLHRPVAGPRCGISTLYIGPNDRPKRNRQVPPELTLTRRSTVWLSYKLMDRAEHHAAASMHSAITLMRTVRGTAQTLRHCRP